MNLKLVIDSSQYDTLWLEVYGGIKANQWWICLFRCFPILRICDASQNLLGTESSNKVNRFLQSSSVWGQIRNCLLILSLGFCSIITCISLEWRHSSFAWRELAQYHHYIFMWFCGEVKINRGLSSPVTTMMDFSCFTYFLLNTSLWTTLSSFLNMIEWGDCVQA